ncbi:cupin domain-containing protein [Mucilaginibacter paludis]|uniref:Cupin 2 conserved barrel domain protein n=1 Tax=Mucilaginibacter paludis DSM 18603 TaxID=714943 RepID=H1YCB7_9SPHI|nr:cupin domain-containing protein [Mucilaginibacter paludis]EHQ30108.1 Cupin 2 conserved barrel domain protein [Mucilaginibacter paludis DSM 18603]
MDNDIKNDVTAADLPLALGAVSKSNCLNQYTWGDDCYGWNFVDTEALSIKQELMPPDTREQLHYHEVANQFFFILTGRATINIDGTEHILKPNEGIEIKAGQKHYISNNVNTDLEFIFYSSPSTNNDRQNVL